MQLAAARPAPDLTDEDEFFLMANVPPGRSGLPFTVWISPGSNPRHDIRVKISPGPRARLQEMMTVQLRPELRLSGGTLTSRELDLLRLWVQLNFDVLLAYWEGRIEDTLVALSMLKPVNGAPDGQPLA